MSRDRDCDLCGRRYGKDQKPLDVCFSIVHQAWACNWCYCTKPAHADYVATDSRLPQGMR